MGTSNPFWRHIGFPIIIVLLIALLGAGFALFLGSFVQIMQILVIGGVIYFGYDIFFGQGADKHKQRQIGRTVLRHPLLGRFLHEQSLTGSLLDLAAQHLGREAIQGTERFFEFTIISRLKLSGDIASKRPVLQKIFPSMFSYFSVLRVLDLSYTGINNIPGHLLCIQSDAFNGLNNLRTLILSFNKGLRDLPDSLFSYLPNLSELILYQTSIPIDHPILTRLRENGIAVKINWKLLPSSQFN
ncbi:MAG: leucine-rich repeat domain-containing protein [Candidatus Heimdallarchaeota archaeon]|nr:leucine-rich repeat domain-containing protein [Candidatus Heimdallarchaeota archaeon]